MTSKPLCAKQLLLAGANDRSTLLILTCSNILSQGKFKAAASCTHVRHRVALEGLTCRIDDNRNSLVLSECSVLLGGERQ